MWLNLLLLTTGAARAEDCSADIAALEAAIEGVRDAYTALREDHFRWRYHEALRLLGCVDAPLEPALATELHLLAVLDARLSGDSERTALAIRGLVTAAPDYTPDPRLAPPGGSLARAIDLAREERWQGETLRLPTDDGTTWFVNGRGEPPELPLDRGVVVQRLDPGADALASWYLPDGAVPPGLLPDPFRDVQRPLTRGAVACAAVAGAAWVVVGLTESHPGSLKGDEPALTLNRAAAIGGLGLSAGALGLGAAAVVTSRW